MIKEACAMLAVKKHSNGNSFYPLIYLKSHPIFCKIGGTHPSSGAKRDATYQEVECQIHCSGNYNHKAQNNLTSTYVFREEADNMCKMLAVSNYAINDGEDLGKVFIT